MDPAEDAAEIHSKQISNVDLVKNVDPQTSEIDFHTTQAQDAQSFSEEAT